MNPLLLAVLGLHSTILGGIFHLDPSTYIPLIGPLIIIGEVLCTFGVVATDLAANP